jgi:hypothetical protein
MKQFYFLTCLLFFMSATGNAQTSDVASGFAFPYALALNGNELFISDIGSDSEKLSKIDITASTRTATDVLTGVSIYGIAIKGNYLYYSDYPNNKISKIDITSSTPIIMDVVTNLNGPVGLAFKGNELYIAENGAGKISKIIDITATTPAVMDVVTDLNLPTKLAFKNNELYFTLDKDGKVSKIDDVTASSIVVTDLVSDLTNPVGIVFKDNELYITEPINRVTDKIYKIDTTENSPTLTEVITGLSGPRGVVFSGDVLYIVESSAGKVSKIDVSTLSIKQFDKNNSSMQIFPNPSAKFIQIFGLIKTENYKIYNILGKQVLDGVVNNQENINTEKLIKGIYFLKFDNGNSLKFIKE